MSDAADCLFCKIVAGEVPSERIAEDDAHVAFLDINPAARTHLLVVPREHHRDLDAWIDAGGDTNATMAFIRGIVQRFGLEGAYRLEVNVGSDAGQELFHLHWHLLSPRERT